MGESAQNRNGESPPEGSGLRPSVRWHEQPALHFALLAGISAYYLFVSWRRWADPVIDFGRELYIPWRLAEGAVLYRDVDNFYGPLSQYLNGFLMWTFGPGLMVLVVANLAVFAGILTTIYFLVRRAWNAHAAFAASAVFVAVFGFSRYSLSGNFNYATPYAHETTHGILVLVLLVAVLSRWLQAPSNALSALGGLLFGLTLVLKPEIIFVAAVLLIASALLQGSNGGRWRAGWIASAAVAAVLPTLLFAGYFSRHLAAADAWAAACRAWLSVVATTRYTGDPVQLMYSGFDAPWTHLPDHVSATAIAVCIVAGLAGAGWIFETRRGGGLARPLALFVVIGVTAGSCLVRAAHWIQVGRCFLGLVLLYLVWLGFALWRGRQTGAARNPVLLLRILLTLLAAVLLARMVLNGRVYQFGYYQAALAAIVLTAALIGELPGWVSSTRAGRALVAMGVLGLIVPGVMILSRVSRRNYNGVTQPIGKGRDLFYGFPDTVSIVRLMSVLEKVPPGQTLLVLPEGLMINYLARLPSPVPPFFFYSVVTENGNEARLVKALAANPPDWVVTLPRDLTEYGIKRYGERVGAGADLLAWVKANYEGAGPERGPAGYSIEFVQLFRRKAAETAAPPVPTAAPPPRH